MSDLIAGTQISRSKDCPASSPKPILQKIPTRKAKIGENLTIRRALPHRERRMIGAWCFLDHFGPLNLNHGQGLNIGPHPHIGLQTFTWTLAGKILHRDSLGSQQIIHPKQVNLMTAGKGIAHSEESLPDGTLHGIQLWIALPNSVRQMAPNFIHYPDIPTFKHDGLVISVLAGELFKTQAPTKVYSPLMGVDLNAEQEVVTSFPLDPKFEYGILPLIGHMTVEEEIVEIDTLLYLGCGRNQLSIRMPQNSRALIIGGEPFKEEILIWWNFVARSMEEVIDATQAWNNGTRFGEVKGYQGDRLTAPDVT